MRRSTHSACVTLGLLLLGFLGQAFGAEARPRQASWQWAQQEVKKRHHVRVAFDVEFPPEWAAWAPKGTPVAAEGRLLVLGGLDRDLRKYDPAFLGTHLTCIYVVDRLEFCGRPTSGYHDSQRRALYMHCRMLDSINITRAPAGFHSVFSRLLQAAHQDTLSERLWMDALPPGFAYRPQLSPPDAGSGNGEGMAAVPDAKGYLDGFLCPFARTSREEDFATYAEYLMGRPHTLQDLSARYPRIARKAAIARRFCDALGAAPPGVPQNRVGKRPAWEQLKAEVEKRHRVEVPFALEFPLHWAERVKAGAPVPVEHRVRVLRTLDKGLAAYDPAFLASCVARVYVFGATTGSDPEYGGTVDAIYGWLYVDEGWLYDSEVGGIPTLLHHELAHLILKTHRLEFPEKPWREANPRGFTYSQKSSIETLREHSAADLVLRRSQHTQGFLCRYGQASLEEDVATYAQYLKGMPGTVDRLCRTYPRVARKVALLKQFYATVGAETPKRP